MSKFEYESFYGGYDDFAVNKEKFTKEQAVEIYKLEQAHNKGRGLSIAICDAFVRHRAGVNGDNEPCVGWWLEYKEHKRSCPVWAFHIKGRYEETFKNYEYVEFT